MQVRRAVGVAVLVVSLVAVGCSSSSSSDGGSGEGGGNGSSSTSSTASHGLVAHGGTQQIWLRTKPNVDLVLYGPNGKAITTQKADDKGVVRQVRERTTDANGAMVIRYLKPGKGYVVKRADDPKISSNPVTVTAFDEHPPASSYAKQEIKEGYGYLTTRDGTKLAINVTLPGPPEKGPYPTVVEYSGYDPANPSPSLVTISKTLAAGQGFATVGVNIRGSGCSGGSFQLWEDAQAVDGYDVIETIAAQPWAKFHKVGMVGISYPASAMLYTAATKPPSLAAIAPMAAYDDGFRALLWPGGMQNKGFARNWIQERYNEAKQDNPSEWVQQKVKEGDETCIDNLKMRGQNIDLAALMDTLPFFPTVNNLGNRFAPDTFVDQIEVPTYLVASWQDEQVGGHAATFIPNFTGVDHGFFTLTNGYHTEGLAEPSVLQRWLEFLQLYVARQVPDTSGASGLYAAVAGQIIGDNDAAGTMPVPKERFSKDMTYKEALAQYEDQPRVRVLLDEGGSTKVSPGVPTAGFEEAFTTFPPSKVKPTTWYLGDGGTLTSAKPTGAGVDSYVSDPSVRPEANLVAGQDSWWKLPKYDWQQPVPENSLSYVGPALTEDTVMVGSGSADLWVKTSEADTDLQVTLTEVRPDGQETYVQSGWLRGSKRKLDTKRSTKLQPLITQLETDAAPMPKGEFEPVRLEIYPFAHAFRKGSRIRVIISAPGGDRPVWSFVTLPGTQENAIARSADQPSAIVLPVVPGIEVPTALPACPSLRGQPCRPYVAQTN